MEERLLTYLDAAERLALEYSDDAWELALTLVRIESISNLVLGFLCLLGAVVLFNLSRKSFQELGTCHYDREVPLSILCVLSGAGSLVGAVIAFVELAHIWNWIGAFNPALRLAREVVRTTTGV